MTGWIIAPESFILAKILCEDKRAQFFTTSGNGPSNIHNAAKPTTKQLKWQASATRLQYFMCRPAVTDPAIAPSTRRRYPRDFFSFFFWIFKANIKNEVYRNE